MTRLLLLLRDRRGAGSIEAGIAIPAFILLCFAIIQFGAALWAQASLANAVGRAARYAIIYPTPSDAQIRSFARNAQLGLDPDKLAAVNVTRGTDAGRPYAEIEIRYVASVDLAFFEIPGITLSESRRAYLPPG